MNITQMVFAINFPIFLGYFFRIIGVFGEEDIPVLRRFVVKVTVPFIIFVNLVKADVRLMHQIIPSVVAFLIMTALFTLVSLALAPIVTKNHEDGNGFCIATFVGNYGYLGWGVMYYFYGDAGFSRSVFFSMFFWPAFLLSGFVITVVRSRGRAALPWRTLFTLIVKNATVPMLSLTLALIVSASGYKIPEFIMESMRSIAALTVPVILFSVGLSFHLKVGADRIGVIVWGVLTRTVFSVVSGITAMLIASYFFPSMDVLTKKTIVLISTMPTAAISPFFAEFLPVNRRISGGILTFSTMFSVVTIPIWYQFVEHIIPGVLRISEQFLASF